MKTQYEYITFIPIPFEGKTTKWDCINTKSGHPLGRVMWYGPWRQYCFHTVGQAIFSNGCLNDIRDFNTQLMDERKKK